MPDRNCCSVIWVIRLSQKPKARSVGLESVNCFKKLCEDSWSRWLFDKSWTCRDTKDWRKVTKYLARMGSDYKSFFLYIKGVPCIFGVLPSHLFEFLDPSWILDLQRLKLARLILVARIPVYKLEYSNI